jgi:hypothetical protein
MTERPPRWLRPRNVLLVVLLLLVGVAVYAVTWALTAAPQPTVDYGQRLEALTARAQPPGENAWPYLVEAGLIMEAVQADLAAEGLDFDDCSPEGLAVIRRAIADLEARGAFEQLALAGRCPNTVRPRPSLEQGTLLFATMPDLAHLRMLARARVASMEFAIAEGAGGDAVKAFDQVLVMGSACSHQATLIEHLVGWAIVTIALEQLSDSLQEHPVDAGTLRRFLDRLQARTPLGDVALGLEGERMSFLDIVQHTHSDNGRGNGRVIPTSAGQFVDTTGYGPPGSPSGDSPRIVNLLGFLMPGRKRLTEEANAFYDDAIRRSRLSYRQRRAETTNLYTHIEELGPRYFLLHMLIPAVGKFLDNADVMRCKIDGARILLAVEGYRAEHGGPPPALAALVPEWLDSVPDDRFSGAPYVYRVAPDTDSGYLLYSVGADGRDDGGAHNPLEPWEALTDDGWGLDFVFNLTAAPDEPD